MDDIRASRQCSDEIATRASNWHGCGGRGNLVALRSPFMWVMTRLLSRAASSSAGRSAAVLHQELSQPDSLPQVQVGSGTNRLGMTDRGNGTMHSRGLIGLVF